MPVTGHVVDTAAVIRAAGAGIGCIGVDFKKSGQHDGPVVIVELIGEEERAGEAVIFRAMVAVVFMSRDGVPSEAIVRIDVRRQLVMMAYQDRLTVPALHQFGRDGSVEGPN